MALTFQTLEHLIIVSDTHFKMFNTVISKCFQGGDYIIVETINHALAQGLYGKTSLLYVTVMFV